MFARKKTGIIAAGVTGVILAAVLTGSASAGTPGCHGDENAGANGTTCVDRVDDVLGVHTGLGVHVGAKVIVGTPNCPDATAALVQAKVIVAGRNGHGGTSKRLTDAESANTAAVKTLNAIAVKYYPVKKAATDASDALAKYDATHGAAPLLPVVPADRAALVKTRDDTAVTLQTVGQQYFDAVSAVYDSNGTKAALESARKAEGRAEQGIVDAEVVIGQACKTPVVSPPAPPAPPTGDSPAQQSPVIVGGNPGPITIINGQAPAPQVVQDNLPVTG